jgi:hypothetical protein
MWVVSRGSTPLPITRPPPTAQRRGKGGPKAHPGGTRKRPSGGRRGRRDSRGDGAGAALPAQRPTQWRPPPRSPHTVRRWSARRPKMANIARRRPTVKVLLRTGFQRDRHVPHRRPVLVLPRRRPQVHTHTLAADPQSKQAPSGRNVCLHIRGPGHRQGRSTRDSRDLPASCAHQRAKLPTHFLPAFLRTGNWYELAERASIAVRRSTMESHPSGSKKTSRRQVDSAISAHCNN